MTRRHTEESKAFSSDTIRETRAIRENKRRSKQEATRIATDLIFIEGFCHESCKFHESGMTRRHTEESKAFSSDTIRETRAIRENKRRSKQEATRIATDLIFIEGFCHESCKFHESGMTRRHTQESKAFSSDTIRETRAIRENKRRSKQEATRIATNLIFIEGFCHESCKFLESGMTKRHTEESKAFSSDTIRETRAIRENKRRSKQEATRIATDLIFIEGFCHESCKFHESGMTRRHTEESKAFASDTIRETRAICENKAPIETRSDKNRDKSHFHRGFLPRILQISRIRYDEKTPRRIQSIFIRYHS
ncbi:MAG: hypothetical protein IPN69_15850 [Acidobacteria bacterium]|nr:hypothetical protein [Acidobacteriota bacterium]